MSKTNPQPKYRLTLRLLAVQLEASNLTAEQRTMLGSLLRHLGDGCTVEDFFDLKPKAHRPETARLEQRIFDVMLLRSPREMGGENLSLKAAIERVAQAHSVQFQTVESDYKSTRGKALRDSFKKAAAYG